MSGVKAQGNRKNSHGKDRERKGAGACLALYFHVFHVIFQQEKAMVSLQYIRRHYINTKQKDHGFKEADLQIFRPIQQKGTRIINPLQST